MKQTEGLFPKGAESTSTSETRNVTPGAAPVGVRIYFNISDPQRGAGGVPLHRLTAVPLPFQGRHSST